MVSEDVILAHGCCFELILCRLATLVRSQHAINKGAGVFYAWCQGVIKTVLERCAPPPLLLPARSFSSTEPPLVVTP